jgi:hypothetical protein
LRFSGFSQSKTYWSSGGEMIFSFASITDKGFDASSNLRWAPVFNLQGTLNNDFNKNFGIFTGLALRNVGYIYDNYTERTSDANTYKKKFRSYNFSLPVGVKIGDLETYFFMPDTRLIYHFCTKRKLSIREIKLIKLQVGSVKDRSCFSMVLLPECNFRMILT